MCSDMQVLFIEYATAYSLNMLQPRNQLKSLVQNHIKPKSQFEFVRQDTEKSQILDLDDFGVVAIPVETVINT